jgi:hypothetical protein
MILVFTKKGIIMFKKSITLSLIALFALLMLGMGKAPRNPKLPSNVIVPTEKIVLWNGKDFSNWKLVLRHKEVNVEDIWSVRDGVIHCKGKPSKGYMRTKEDYANYKLHVEWRWPGQPGNSGVLVHMSEPDFVWPKCLECQLQAGRAGDFWLIGDQPSEYEKGVSTAQRFMIGDRFQGRNTLKLNPSSEKPTGQWNSYDIICKDDWVVVMVNGVLQNVATECTVTSGKICLQSESALVEFRNVYLEPVE